MFSENIFKVISLYLINENDTLDIVCFKNWYCVRIPKEHLKKNTGTVLILLKIQYTNKIFWYI